MAKYEKGEHVKIEVVDEESGESEWMWLLVDSCDDAAGVVFGRLDTQPIVNVDMHVGQELAVSFEKIRGRQRF